MPSADDSRRPPQGDVDNRVRLIAAGLNLTNILWVEDSVSYSQFLCDQDFFELIVFRTTGVPMFLDLPLHPPMSISDTRTLLIRLKVEITLLRVQSCSVTNLVSLSLYINSGPKLTIFSQLHHVNTYEMVTSTQSSLRPRCPSRIWYELDNTLR